MVDEVSISIRNLGGIESLETSFSPGVSILSGENATNRTSLLRSVAAALGADDAAATLKTDRDTGSVTLNLDGTTATRTYERSKNRVATSGDPLTSESELVDTYVALFATNPARGAIRTGGDGLRDILMRGVDTEETRAEIHSLKQRRNALEDRLAEIQSAKDDLPDHRETESRLSTEIEELEAEIAEVKAEIDEFESSSEEIEEAESRLDDLESLREQRRRIQTELEETRSSISEYFSRRAELRYGLETMAVSEERQSDLESRKRDLTDRIRDLQSTVQELNEIISHNRTVLEERDVIGAFGSEQSVTAHLDPGEATVECWVCGSDVKKSKIEGRIETLEELREEKQTAVQDLRDELDDVETELEGIRRNVDRRDRLEEQLSETKAALESERSTLERLANEDADLREEIESLEATVAETDDTRGDDYQEAYQRLSQLRHRLGQKESELESVRDTIAELEDEIADGDRVEEELNAVREDLFDARERIDRIESSVVERFNEQMEDLLDLLDYQNVSRVWLERLATEGNSTSTYEIHVVRESEDGVAYEDTLDTLSESEREIIGIIVALSGYLVHDLSDSIPFVLFDSIESIDAPRLEKLFEYVSDYAPFIVAALLPEDASAIDEQTIEAPAFSR